MTDKMKNIIEALLFASDMPLTIQKLKEILEVNSIKDIRKGLDKLEEHYAKTDSAMRIIEVAGGFQIVSKEDYSAYVQKLYKGRQASRLTQRALETLAIIAYKQPITKHEMENIRGVNVDGVVKTLLERNLVSIEGREKAPGNPLLYGTTKYFLEYFGLNSLDALPKLKEIDELLKEDDKFLESLDQVALKQIQPEALGLTSLAEAKSDDSEINPEVSDEHPQSDQGKSEKVPEVSDEKPQSEQGESEKEPVVPDELPHSNPDESAKHDASE
jgi:segregation and condensation protein B